MARPIEQWRNVEEFNKLLDEMKAALVHRVPEDIAVSMANLQGLMDWFQIKNKIELNAQRIEAEFSRYDEEDDDEVTVRHWPPSESEGQYGSG